MSKAQTTTAERNDEQTNEASDLFQRDADGAELDPCVLLCDTELQDLPIEILECILVKAVILEVKDMKLAKSVWKEKADLVMDRLGTVCLQWNSILTNNFLRSKVKGILDGTANETFRLEVLRRCQMNLFVFRVATVRDEMFMLWRPGYRDPFIDVHNRNDLATVKDVIPLPGILPVEMAGCGVSNCVYILNQDSHCVSVLRITRDAEQQFEISPWINDPCLTFSELTLSFPQTIFRLSVSVDGSLIILSKEITPKPSLVSIYNVHGSLKHAITLSPAVHGFISVFSVIQKSNGNLVLATTGDRLETDLKEIDMTGRIIRQYCSSLLGDGAVSIADFSDRIWISDLQNKDELLDSEFNSLNVIDRRPNGTLFHILYGVHYNSERNEIVFLCETAEDDPIKGLTIFRFTRE